MEEELPIQTNGMGEGVEEGLPQREHRLHEQGEVEEEALGER